MTVPKYDRAASFVAMKMLRASNTTRLQTADRTIAPQSQFIILPLLEATVNTSGVYSFVLFLLLQYVKPCITESNILMVLL